MGLEMTLYVKTYTKSINDKFEIVNMININSEIKNSSIIKEERIIFLIEEVGIWRNAFHIHKWFVENVQDGIDNSADYCVTEDYLEELLNTCKEVINEHSKAPILLPNYDAVYDEYYFDQIKDTISIIQDVFSEFKVNGRFIKSIYYSCIDY